MSDKGVRVTVNEDQKQMTIDQLEASGSTIVGVNELAETVNESDNSTRRVQITAKNFNAKLGHIEREFVD